MATVNRTSIRHEIVGESFQVAGVVMEFQQPVVVVIRDDDVFGVAGHVNDLQIQPNCCISFIAIKLLGGRSWIPCWCWGLVGSTDRVASDFWWSSGRPFDRFVPDREGSRPILSWWLSWWKGGASPSSSSSRAAPWSCRPAVSWPFCVISIQISKKFSRALV